MTHHIHQHKTLLYNSLVVSLTVALDPRGLGKVVKKSHKKDVDKRIVSDILVGFKKGYVEVATIRGSERDRNIGERKARIQEESVIGKKTETNTN